MKPRVLAQLFGMVAILATTAPASNGLAAPCRQTARIQDTCTTGYDIRGSSQATDYIFAAGCQINLQREIHAALRRKGYTAEMVGPYLGAGDIAAIQCEQAQAGLPVTGRLDRQTIRQILGRDLFADRCRAAGLGPECPLLAP